MTCKEYYTLCYYSVESQLLSCRDALKHFVEKEKIPTCGLYQTKNNSDLKQEIIDIIFAIQSIDDSDEEEEKIFFERGSRDNTVNELLDIASREMGSGWFQILKLELDPTKIKIFE